MAQEDCTPLWDKYPTDLDGWVLAHTVIRDDEKRLTDLVSALLSQCERGIALSPAQRSALLDYWTRLNAFFHKHHEAEDLFVVPYMINIKKLEVPAIMKSKYVHIFENLEKCNVLVESGRKPKGGGDASSDAATLRQVAEESKKLAAYCKEHFEMEENQVLPLLRANCTPAEVSTHITKPIVGKMSVLDMGDFFSKMSPEKLKAFTKQEKMSWSKVMMIKFGIWRYNLNIINPVEDAVEHATKACAKRRGSSSRHS